jgi:beta-galactosidase
MKKLIKKTLKLTGVLCYVFWTSVCFAQQTTPRPPAFTDKCLSFNKGWKFFLGDIPMPDVKGHTESYNNAKAGHAAGAAAPAFDDKSWRIVDLPHDWSVEQPFDSTENVSQGYHKRGFGWYRRKFKLDSALRGKYLEIQFEGVATHCTVWINGLVVHRNWSGYTSFYIDISDIARYGDELNTIAVRVDAKDQEGWWYEGSGIYRNVWLVEKEPVHIITDGVFANPVYLNGDNWKIPGEVTVNNSGKHPEAVQVEMSVLDKQNNVVATGKSSGQVNELQQATLKTNILVQKPHIWDINDPYLYRVITRVKKAGLLCDSMVTYCGFRTFRFDANKGFFLNGRHVKIKGVCNHQDHAGVGVAMPASLWEFRLRKLKEMGVNAIRCSHNPPAKEVLDLCDRMGILVMDENRNFNSSPEYVSQLKWMVQRDRNHPGIILWSVFNEEPMQGSEQGYEMVRRMRAVVRDLDTTRPVTAAMNSGLFTPINVSQAVDVVGFNYQIPFYDRFHQAHPDMLLTSSEDVSGLMQRGVYQTDLSKHLLDSYDDQKPGWGNTHREAWKAIAERDFLAGCFIWTGFDYRGEPTPFTWPTVSSNFGCMDMCGFPKTAFFIHQAQWTEGKDVIHIEPHWNWPKDTIGKPIKVMVISNAEVVRLVLNGKVLGEQKVDPYEMNTWMVPYQPGKLEAIGLKTARKLAEQPLKQPANR